MASPYAISLSSPNVREQFPSRPVPLMKKGDVLREVYCDITTVPSETYPPEPAILRAIWVVEPEVVPVWIRRVYRAPTGGDFVFGYHGLYRYRTVPETERPVIPELHRIGVTSVGKRFPRPNVEWLVLEGDPPVPGWPGIFLPFNWRTYQDLKKAWYFSQFVVEDNEKLAKCIVEQAAEKEAKEQAALQAESDYRWDQEWDFQQRQKAQLTREDIESIGQPPAKKPFVHLGHALPVTTK
jgi:hypothetical protein